MVPAPAKVSVNMDRLYNILPALVSTVAGISLAAVLGWQGYGLWQQWQAEPELEAGGAAAEREQTSPALEVSLDELKVFGVPGEEPTEPEVVDTEDLPETNLRLVLRGVMAGRSEHLTSALVEGPDSETDVYRVGEELPGEARLHQVYQRRIVIERNGELENLSFPEEDTDGEVAVRGSRSESSRDGDAGSETTSRRTPSGDQDAVRARLEELRERLRN